MRLTLGEVIVEVDETQDVREVLALLMRTLTDQEAGRILDVSERTIGRWRKDGRLPGRNRAGSSRLTMLDLLNLHGLTDKPKGPWPGSATQVSSAGAAL